MTLKFHFPYLKSSNLMKKLINSHFRIDPFKFLVLISNVNLAFQYARTFNKFIRLVSLCSTRIN